MVSRRGNNRPFRGWLRSRAYLEARRLLDEAYAEFKRFANLRNNENRPTTPPPAPPAPVESPQPPIRPFAILVASRSPSPPSRSPSPIPESASPALSEALTIRIFPDTPPSTPDSSIISIPFSPRRTPSPTNSTDSVEFLEEIPSPPPRTYFQLQESDSFESLIRQLPRTTEPIPEGTYTIGVSSITSIHRRYGVQLPLSLLALISLYSSRIPPIHI
ncbi:hypothetical protein ALC57_11720 [Trachymyrmex cornetzi]|uniref:Uncharacterized protein n=1 Tax=Trachymyrmex cornetzi TaxID=471704 RepID=A0A151J247_9HYME|nr:hypothetical protein ALC57_11720 [Trachymyrmex cornetzi]